MGRSGISAGDGEATEPGGACGSATVRGVCTSAAIAGGAAGDPTASDGGDVGRSNQITITATTTSTRIHINLRAVISHRLRLVGRMLASNETVEHVQHLDRDR